MEPGNFDNTQHHRVVAYFDVDCFYAQAEVLRRPYLQDRPVGVTQKFLVVTCNYVARQLGVPKMASIQEAKQRCPDLVLINGEDLTPYRAASKNIMAVLGRFGVLERRGLDEAALDITIEVLKRSASMPSCLGFSGHVLGLKGLGESGLEMSVPSYLQDVDPIRSDYYLMVGSQLVAEIRAAVEKETGYRCSSGIAINKMLAKLVSSVNKPNKQTCILESAVSSFLESLHVRKLPGIGHQTESVLKDMGITTVADLQQITFQHLSRKFGNRMGMLLYNSCRGVDNSLVQNKGPPKSLSVEDSFQPCTSFKQAEEIIRSLAPDLIARLDEDKEEHSRRPKVFTVKWRYPGNWAFKSASAPMPLELLSASVPLEKRLETVVEVAVKLLSHSLGRQSFSLVVLNIGATSFTVSSSASSGASHDIRSFLHSPGQSSKQLSKVMSKREARVYREECEKEKANANLVRPLFGNLGRDGALHGRRVQTHSYNILEMEEQNCELDSDEEERAPKLYNDLSFMEQPFLVHGQPFLVHGIPQERLEASRDLRSSSYSHSPVSSTHESTLHKESPSKASSDAPPSSSSVMVDHATCSSMINDVALDNVIGTLNPNMARVEENSTALASLSQERLVESITYSNGIPLDSVALHHSDFVCEACGQELRGDAQSKQEHDDYHLALDWTSQEQSLLKSFAKPYPSPSITLRGTKKKNKATREHQLLLKRRKMQNGTLDCFVYRSQG